MARTRSIVIALTVLAVMTSLIALVLWFALARSRTSSGRGITSVSSGTGTSAVAGGISSLEMSVIAGAGLAVCFGIAACVVLLVRKSR